MEGLMAKETVQCERQSNHRPSIKPLNSLSLSCMPQKCRNSHGNGCPPPSRERQDGLDSGTMTSHFFQRGQRGSARPDASYRVSELGIGWGGSEMPSRA